MQARTLVGALAPLVVWAAGLAGSARAQEPTPPDPAPRAPGEASFFVENLSRAELWRYFAPTAAGGRQPDYAFAGTRFSLGAAYRGPRWSVDGTLQYVRVENLPAGAIGPGLLGTGGAYFFQAGGTFSYQFYLRTLNLTWRQSPDGPWLQIGRFSRAARTEPSSGDSTIDRVMRDDLNGRLLGDMEWTFYQRAWDGVRAGVARRGVRVTAMGARPTQGTYEESANLTMERVGVASLEATADPGVIVPRTRLEVFAHYYDDTRAITPRPDNTGRLMTRADVQVATAGASAVGAYPAAGGTWDASLWLATQTGSWYEQDHRASAASVAVGYGRPRASWAPWLRAGITYASGDGDRTDPSHRTFFPMLPSTNRLSQANLYALMNLVDRWAEVRATPVVPLDLEVSVHDVRLADGADRWYQGSGATMRSGTYFGFNTRNLGGERGVGTVIDATATWRAFRFWTVRAYVARMSGGAGVRRVFAGARLSHAWLESTVSF